MLVNIINLFNIIAVVVIMHDDSRCRYMASKSLSFTVMHIHREGRLPMVIENLFAGE